MTRHLKVFGWIFGWFLGLTAAHCAPLLVDANVPVYSLESHADLLVDRSKTLDFRSVPAGEAASDFRPMQGRPIGLGFSDATVWVRFQVEAPANAPVRRYLELTQPLLEDVQLYDLSGTSTGGGHSGIGIASNPIHALNIHKPLFVIALQAGETRSFLLRLRTQTSMSTQIRLWDPDSYLVRSARENYLWGLVFGANGMMILFYLMFFTWSRERVLLAYSAYITVNFAAAFFTGGWPELLLPQTPVETLNTWLGVFVTLSMASALWFSSEYLDTRALWPRATRAALVASTCAAGIGSAFILAGHYQATMQMVQATSLALIALVLSMATALALKRHRNAGFFILAFSPFYVGVAWRYMRNIGYLEPSFLNDNSYQIGSFVHLLLMGMMVFNYYRHIRQDKESAEAQAKAERTLREEQQEFLSMVSHETRTPLAVISVSAENLLAQANVDDKGKTRATKILRSAERIQELIASYLSHERLEDPQQTFQPCEVDLVKLCQRAIAEQVHNKSIGIELVAPPALEALADSGLLRIAIGNLLENARRYAGTDAHIQIKLWADPKAANIAVSDNGPGIATEDLPNIFRRYYRGRNSRSMVGSGLGLFLTQRIAAKHGGTVEVRPSPQGGTTFVISLPRWGLPRS